MLRSISNHSLIPAQSAEVPRSTAADQGGSLFDVHPEAFGSFRVLDNIGSARSAEKNGGRSAQKDVGAAPEDTASENGRESCRTKTAVSVSRGR